MIKAGNGNASDGRMPEACRVKPALPGKDRGPASAKKGYMIACVLTALFAIGIKPIAAADAKATLSPNPGSIVTASRPISSVIPLLQEALGATIQLVGIDPGLRVVGEFRGDSGVSLLNDFAKKAKLEWASEGNLVALGQSGSRTAIRLPSDSKDVLEVLRRRLQTEYGQRGSNVQIDLLQGAVEVRALDWLINKISPQVDDLIEGAQRELDERDGQSFVRSKDEPLVLMTFELRNAWVDDKSITVGGAGVRVPGVASYFRDLTGLQGPSAARADAKAAPAPGQLGDGAGAKRLDRTTPIAGGTRPTKALADAVKESTEKAEAREKTETKPDSTSKPAGGTGSASSPSASASAPGAKSNPGSSQRATARSPQPADAPSETPVVIADPRLNALIVRDRASKRDEYKKLIDFLDRPTHLVQIEAFIVDISKSRLNDFGVAFNWLGTNTVTGQVNAGNALNSGSNVVLSFLKGAELVARVRALESKGDSQLVSVPSVVAINNNEAVFSSSENFYVAVAGNQDSSLTSVSAVTSLRVTPLVVSGPDDRPSDRQIRILLNIQDGNVDGTEASLVSNLPRIKQTQITTQAVVKEGDMLVVGGQVIRRRVKQRGSVPVISDLPLLGAVFGTRSDEDAEFIRIFMVRPTVIEASGSGTEALASARATQAALPQKVDAFVADKAISIGEGKDLSTVSSRSPRARDMPQAPAQMDWVSAIKDELRGDASLRLLRSNLGWYGVSDPQAKAGVNVSRPRVLRYQPSQAALAKRWEPVDGEALIGAVTVPPVPGLQMPQILVVSKTRDPVHSYRVFRFDYVGDSAIAPEPELINSQALTELEQAVKIDLNRDGVVGPVNAGKSTR